MSRQTNVDFNTNRIRVPSAYKVSEIVLRNYAGQEYNISKIVADFSITESIYRSTLTLSMSIRDDSNFMEQAALSGHESVRVILDRQLPNDELQRVDHVFRITEYPVFAKYNNNVQVYRMNGISNHAYISKFKKISRAFNGVISEFVEQVFVTDLNFERRMIKHGDDSTGSAAFIVPYMEPIDAAHWALRRAFNSLGSPFYLFQTLDGNIHVKSQKYLVEQPQYKTYDEAKFFEHDIIGQEQQAFNERARRILNVDSDLNLSKPFQAANGAFSSRTEYIDIANKTRSIFKFDYLERFANLPSVEGYPLLAPNLEIDEQKYCNSYDKAKINVVPLNSNAYNNVGNYHSRTSRGMINFAQSQFETLDTQQHTLTLNGDFNLNCGKIVNLKFIPSVDPRPRKNNSRGPNDRIDDYLSGSYLVSSIVHNFAEDYIMEVKVKRDSSPENEFEMEQ